MNRRACYLGVMENLQRFMQYAADFEDARRRRLVAAAPVLCGRRRLRGENRVFRQLTGPDAIFKGMKKSLDGFDRKFDGRSVDLTSGPDVEGDTIRMGWTVTYRKAGKTPYPLHGRSEVRYRDGKIAYLGDSYDASVGPAAAAWMHENGMTLDPSYV
jgi:hypothetical protein